MKSKLPTKGPLILLMAGLGLAGCHSDEDTLTPAAEIDANKAEAVISYILNLPDRNRWGIGESYCVEIDKKAVDAATLARFNAIRPRALPRDRCIWRNESEVIDRQTMARSSILSIDRQFCNASGTRCILSANNAFGNLGSYGADYQVTKDGNSWQVTETGLTRLS